MTTVQVGDRIKFSSERQSYRVCAADGRFAVCIKPFNARKTTLYTIVDFERGVRGPDNIIFSQGYETDEDAKRALGQLQRGEIEVSHRRHVALDIEKIIPSRPTGGRAGHMRK